MQEKNDLRKKEGKKETFYCVWPWRKTQRKGAPDCGLGRRLPLLSLCVRPYVSFVSMDRHNNNVRQSLREKKKEREDRSASFVFLALHHGATFGAARGHEEPHRAAGPKCALIGRGLVEKRRRGVRRWPPPPFRCFFFVFLFVVALKRQLSSNEKMTGNQWQTHTYGVKGSEKYIYIYI